MTGPEHYRIAEQLLADAAASKETTFEGYNPIADRGIAAATAHFLAAQVALAAMSHPIMGMPDEPGLGQEEFDDWYAAVNDLSTTSGEPETEPCPIFSSAYGHRCTEGKGHGGQHVYPADPKVPGGASNA